MKKLFLMSMMSFVMLPMFSQSCPDSNHPHAIDLGLPSGLKWACCNVGASSPSGDGDAFAWSNTTDVARSRWGSAWSVPSDKQMDEMLSNTQSAWTTVNGVNGRLFRSIVNGKTIFFPAAGFTQGVWEGRGQGKEGVYWTSSAYPGTGDGCLISITADRVKQFNADSTIKMSIRPICK